MQTYLKKFFSFAKFKAYNQTSIRTIYPFSTSKVPQRGLNLSEKEDFSAEFSEDEENFEEIDDGSVKEDFTTTEDLQDFQERNFIDRVRLDVVAGKGGDGCYTFYRDRLVKAGAPDGGDGGNGGSVYFKATNFFSDLRHLKKPTIEGNKGRNGGKGKKHGKNGKDIYVSVPVGTLVWEIKSVQKNEEAKENSDAVEKAKATKITALKRRIIGDLAANNSVVLAAKGGQGGHGNGMHPGVKGPGRGKLGQEIEIFLELKSIADIGLVGFPNAGKSTVLATFTRALAKIAPYPFTTLQPTVGTIKFIDDFEMSIADIPGLIEGSHLNKGLGHEFLKHIERTKVLMYVIDINADDPASEFRILQKELELHNKKIFESKPFMIVLNKIDLVPDPQAIIDNVKRQINTEVLGISAKHSQNLDKIVVSLRVLVEKQRKIEEENARKEAEASKS